jgi:hypothetical protein
MRVRAVMGSTLLVCWPAAWASLTVVDDVVDLLGLPWLQAGVGVAIALLGGVTATLGRYLESRYDGRPFLLRLEMTKDCSVSAVVGLGTYFAGGGGVYAMPPMALGLVLLLGGYAGTRLLSAAVDRLLASVRGGGATGS